MGFLELFAILFLINCFYLIVFFSGPGHRGHESIGGGSLNTDQVLEILGNPKNNMDFDTFSLGPF